ncbi:MAG: hypothetical protein ACETVU_03455 [Desulfatiglandales bacterium]
MARLSPGDVRAIVQVLEDGISLMPRLGRPEKLKMRSKIRKQFNWLAEQKDPTADMLFLKLQERLPDVFSLYPYGFGDKVKKLLQQKSGRLGSM